ncbi:MAG: amino acid adenylation domain-containing protein [Flavobacteriales bacterium]|nr:amino acid adenylation domain-containing protein [Flavobacteriales bacterium]
MVERPPYDPITLFRSAASRWPERVALSCSGTTFTYRQLDRWSDAIANKLIVEGHGTRIAFVAEKRPESYAAILGILKSGRAYVPLGPDTPPARWEEMIMKAEVRSVIGGSVTRDGLRHVDVPMVDDEIATVLDLGLRTDEAYVLFTSGSTGGPKGVSVSRANVAAYLGHSLATYAFSENDRFTQFFALTFDLSVHDLFLCWASGACLCVPDAHAALRASAFVREHGISVWFSVPSVVTVMQRMRSLTNNALPSLRYAFFCGEALSWPLVQAFREAAPGSRIMNLYGPTEATIAITAYEVFGDVSSMLGIVPIGVPFTGSSVRIEDEELLLGGPQVASGYVNDGALTDHAFVQRSGGRWYRTGDRVRIHDDGLLHFHGRMDEQVKVLGHRVEPAEVDAVITSLLNGGSSATVPVTGPTSTRLVTFIDVAMEAEPLLERCRAKLPAYMVPERIIALPALPLNPHGKVDRKQLISIANDV